MRYFPSAFPSLTTTRHGQNTATSDTSSPPSSRTTSPPSSPTSSTFRRYSAHNLFKLNTHPHPHPIPHPPNEESGSGPDNIEVANSTTSAHYSVSILPCAVLRGRSSLMVLRRRPSATDMVLSEERARCDEDAIERQGLDLMEPRPVNMNLPASAALAMAMHSDRGAVSTGAHSLRSEASFSADSRGVVTQPPRFVMGGIFEVMEGRA